MGSRSDSHRQLPTATAKAADVEHRVPVARGVAAVVGRGMTERGAMRPGFVKDRVGVKSNTFPPRGLRSAPCSLSALGGGGGTPRFGNSQQIDVWAAPCA